MGYSILIATFLSAQCNHTNKNPTYGPKENDPNYMICPIYRLSLFTCASPRVCKQCWNPTMKSLQHRRKIWSKERRRKRRKRRRSWREGEAVAERVGAPTRSALKPCVEATEWTFSCKCIQICFACFSAAPCSLLIYYAQYCRWATLLFASQIFACMNALSIYTHNTHMWLVVVGVFVAVLLRIKCTHVSICRWYGSHNARKVVCMEKRIIYHIPDKNVEGFVRDARSSAWLYNA